MPRGDVLELIDDIKDAIPGELDDAQDVLDARDGMLLLDLKFTRDQQNQQFEEYRGIVLHHLIDSGLATAIERLLHRLDGGGVENLPCATEPASRVSNWPRCKIGANKMAGARFEISIDGKTRSCREDIRSIVQSRHPGEWLPYSN